MSREFKSIKELNEYLSSIKDKIKKFLNKDIKEDGIVLSKKRLIHASPKRKEAYSHSFRVDEMRQIIDVLEDDDNAYIDLRDKHKNIVYIFEDEKDNTKLNLIPIEISKMHKWLKQSNYIITMDKVNKKDIQKDIATGFIKKVK